MDSTETTAQEETAEIHQLNVQRKYGDIRCQNISYQNPEWANDKGSISYWQLPTGHDAF
jgi:hypothetical protein